MNRFWLETYGCQMNKAESNALEDTMLESGWIPAEQPQDADLVILNTCSVRLTAENRIWGRIGYFKTLKALRPHTLVVMGCMAQRLADDLKKAAPAVDMVVGTFQKAAFARMLSRAASRKQSLTQERQQDEEYSFSSRHARKTDYRAFVPIMHGCNNFCSYCIVPYVRGREVSRDPRSIFAEIDGLLRQGRVREITLLGQNVNSYRFSSGPDETPLDFPGLLDEIVSRFPVFSAGQTAVSGGSPSDVPWLRFLTSHPKDFSGALIERMAAYPCMCRQIHLPVQHGSDTILRSMNRQYTRSDYLSLVERIRKKLPDVLLSTDILIGFPGETDEDFCRTLDLMRQVGFDDAFTYYYNPREGTAAWSMQDTVPEKLKHERLTAVIDLQRATSAAKKKQRLGKKVRVLAGEISRKNSSEILGRTEGDEMVVFPGAASLIGNFYTVRLAELRGNTFYGHEVAE
ncbi:MAG: tRNA (N6-isopentenyl adenosine(37)-C2)-methylthiotransferase MiaB [Spirochaetales bacterium]|jgi:tRNA-2-methylthio-N6-dimethylallyladenosine synthase|nr:tRNA (N6-isopentenyl adenosine(37)-C2)-methylthiotransferase MiaB [Spirochaetales bacterium]